MEKNFSDRKNRGSVKNNNYITTLQIAPVQEWNRLLSHMVVNIHMGDIWLPTDLNKPISMAQAKEIIVFAQQMPFQEKKMVIIPGVDQMRLDVSNTLLKTIEEPPPYLEIIMLAETVNIIPTILSRVQIKHLGNISDKLNAVISDSNTQKWIGAMEELRQDENNLEKIQNLLYLASLSNSSVKVDIVLDAYKK